MGDIRLGEGSNKIDTHLGSLIGTIFGVSLRDDYVIAGTERIIEAANGGDDYVTSYGDYRMADNLENLTLAGDARVGVGNAVDNVLYATEHDCRLFGLAGADTLNGASGDDLLVGGGGDDNLYGREGDNVLRGGDGDNSLSVEGDGANTLFGGDGDDVLTAAAGADILRGGAGVDAVVYSASTAGVIVKLTTSTVTEGWATGDAISGIEWRVGSLFGDRLTGSTGANFLIGFGGDDVLAGLDGDDRLEGGAGADQLDGGLGSDSAEYNGSPTGVTVNLAIGRGAGGDATCDRYTAFENVPGSGAADTLTGSDVANVLHGGGGADTLTGGKGADTLFGDAGDDILNGGADADIFASPDVTPGLPGFGDDLVTTFQNGVDTLSFVGSSAVHAFGDVFFVQDGADTLITVAGNSIRLSGFSAANLDASDFVFG